MSGINSSLITDHSSSHKPVVLLCVKCNLKSTEFSYKEAENKTFQDFKDFFFKAQPQVVSHLIFHNKLVCRLFLIY
jgi:hypothetical protein